MRLSEFDLEKREGRRVSSPGKCIYCTAVDRNLSDEHVIPYALGANTLILEKACCESCQRIIQRYEQEVLKKQLGIFRAQVDAPTRNKKDRPAEVKLNFIEVDSRAQKIRDLGFRSVPIDEAPVVLNLWSSPEPRLLRDAGNVIDENGQPWSFYDEKMLPLCRAVAKEEGATNVAIKLGEVNRSHYLRSLAKTAHAYAVAELGLNAFQAILPDLILCKTDDVANFVGDCESQSPFELHPAHTLQMSIGEENGYLVVRIQLYPMLNSPAHVVVLGTPSRVFE